MARKFNLQPWRAQRREEQRKTFTYATIAIVIACALALAANYWYETNYIEQQEVAKEQIKSETAKLSKAKSEVERLTELNRQVNLQIEVIQGLQAQRGLVTEMLDYIAKNTPETIFLFVIWKNFPISRHRLMWKELRVPLVMKRVLPYPQIAK